MQLTNKTLRGMLLLLAGLFIAVFLYSWLVFDDPQYLMIFGVIPCLTLSYRLSKPFESENRVDKLISRQNTKLIILPLRLTPFVKSPKTTELDIKRISRIAVGDDLLSIILDKNGQGFDFQMIGSAQLIKDHIKSLLENSELSTIEIELV